MTATLNVLHRDNWTRLAIETLSHNTSDLHSIILAIEVLNNYTRAVYDANNVSGWDVGHLHGASHDDNEWSYG